MNCFRSKEVSAKDSTITVYDLQLNHAKAVTNASYRVLVEQGSRAAKVNQHFFDGKVNFDLRHIWRTWNTSSAACARWR